MQKEKKTFEESMKELDSAIDELVEEIISAFDSWLSTGKEFMPDYLTSFLGKLKEKGLKIVNDDEN